MIIPENTVFKEIKEQEIKIAKENILERYFWPEEYNVSSEEETLDRYFTPEYFDLSDIEPIEDELASKISPMEMVMLLDHFKNYPDDNFFVIRKNKLIKKWIVQNKGGVLSGYVLEELEKLLKENQNLFEGTEFEEILEDLSYVLAE